MRYRSHSNVPAAITGEDLTKSQRISQFLEDVSRQLQPPYDYQSQPVNTTTIDSNKNNHSNNTAISYIKLHNSSNRAGPPRQRVTKYPTYERETKVVSDQKTFITG